jgi:hypothetical protein
MDFFRT